MYLYFFICITFYDHILFFEWRKWNIFTITDVTIILFSMTTWKDITRMRTETQRPPMEYFWDTETSNGVFLRHIDLQWSISETQRPPMEYFWDAETSNGVFLRHRDLQWSISETQRPPREYFWDTDTSNAVFLIRSPDFASLKLPSFNRHLKYVFKFHGI